MIQLLGAGISGVGVGTSLGLLGGGGSILTVPILVYLLSVPVPQAVVISLVVVLAASFAGATAYVRAGEVPMVRIASFAAAGAVGTVVGAYINKSLSESTVLMAFAAMMIVAAWVMLRSGTDKERTGVPRPLFLVAGAGVGFLTGLLGVGGGFVIVPALRALGLPMRSAIGGSLVVIALNSGIGLVAHLGVPFDTTIGGAFAASAVAGAFLGKRLSMRTPPDRLARGFAFMVAIVGVVVLVEEIAVRGKLV